MFHFGTHMRHKGWKVGKTFIRCYTIALKEKDEFNPNFVWLCLSSYNSIKMWHLYLKKMWRKTIRQGI